MKNNQGDQFRVNHDDLLPRGICNIFLMIAGNQVKEMDLFGHSFI